MRAVAPSSSWHGEGAASSSSLARSFAAPRRASHSFPSGARGFTLLELMIVVFIIGMLASSGLTVLAPKVERAMTMKFLPYSHPTMTYVAGYHTLHGEWPKRVPNLFASQQVKTDIHSLLEGRFPANIASVPGQPVWTEGELHTHEGSILVSGVVVNRDRRDNIAFFLDSDTSQGLPVPFKWRCGSRDRPSTGGLPDPSTLPYDSLPLGCQRGRGSE